MPQTFEEFFDQPQKETKLDKPINPEELVWIDDGFSDVIAIYGTEWTKPRHIRRPVQKKRKDVQPGQLILTPKDKKLYDDCIQEVELRKKLKAKGKV